jgi:hypothetical protein
MKKENLNVDIKAALTFVITFIINWQFLISFIFFNLDTSLKHSKSSTRPQEPSVLLDLNSANLSQITPERFKYNYSIQ